MILNTQEFAWTRVESKEIADCRVFRIRQDLSRSPHDGSVHDFYCIEAADWINIIPLTAANEVVMIEQYRHGSEEVTLEIPGGMIDAGESAQVAATRELLEETGYVTDNVLPLGKTRPNPAIQNNWLHCFVAKDVTFDRKPDVDSTEHTSVKLVPLVEVPGLIKNGTINHSLVVVAFYLYSLFERRS